MPSRPPKIRRSFAGGWLADADASLMALVWHIHEPEGPDQLPDHYEAEVIRGVEQVASLSSEDLDELWSELERRFGDPEHASTSHISRA